MAHLIRLFPITVILVFLSLPVLADEGDSARPEYSTPSNQNEADQLAVRLAAIHTMAAQFIQRTIDDSGNQISESRGNLLVTDQGRFRIETQLPFQQVLVSDGENFWTYDEELAQVVIRPLQADVQRMPILMFGGSPAALKAEYRITAFEQALSDTDHDSPEIGFILEPLEANALFEVMTLRFKGETPSRIDVRDSFGQTINIQFSGTGINGEGVSEADFTFINPPGVDVIDDR